ncbi:cadherin-24 [Anolis carolinensis]|uniref:Cadherin 24 n=1 Tax=Anolis carolinensis TaxID=28377 RepID=H9GCD3_ANOCA|nr:PREDICTED: cadherin-24 [Anolis carolinensis]|eukprot:XP_003229066.1 PREDICTED: cadherin-24 [Anolis carolinensis]
MASFLQLLLAWLGGCGCVGRLVPLVQGTKASTFRGNMSQRWEKPLLRSRRSWVWNQFFVIEEYAGPEPVLIGRLHTDVDRGEGRIKYVLTGEGAGTVFVIDEKTGNIHVTKTLDREEKAQYTLLAQAVDRASNRPLEPPSEFIIKVQDINDNPPVFLHGPYHATVPEMSNVGTSVIQVTAQDADDPLYGNSARLVYTVLEGLPFFSVDPQTGVIRTATPNMDRETQQEFLVVVQAKDMGGHAGGLSGSTTVTVTLSDVNDNPPRFPQSSYQFSVVETAPPGSVVGRLRAHDPDEGENALLAYSILDGGDGAEAFAIHTDSLGQDGIITVKKPLDFESRRSYTFRVEATNTLIDPQYIRKGPFKDIATVRITVEDADEPPSFSRSEYHLAVYENSPPGTLVGKVAAVDLDSPSSVIRYSILLPTDPERYFSINPQDGTILTSVPLDREVLPWHNMTVVATELDSPTQASHVQVAIQILDVNDNPPQLEHSYEPFICDNSVPGQLVQLIRAVDRDEDGNTSRIIIRSPHGIREPNVTVRDNKDNSASLLLRAGRLPAQGTSLLVPLELVDGGSPTRTGSPTLTVSICRCRRDGAMHSCGPEAQGSPAGLSTGALLAILACVGTLLALVLLFVALRRQKQTTLLPFEEEDVRENIITYDDEGGGEEDTEAFDMAALQNPDAAPPPPQHRRLLRRDVLPRPHFTASLSTRVPPQPHDVASFLAARLCEVDSDPSVPPYDSIQVYGYEGQGSSAGSLSSPGSSCAGDSDAGGYEYLEEWGPLFRTLAELYGAPEGPPPPT